MKKKFYTPQIDGIIEGYAGTDFGTYNRRKNSCISKKITAILEQLHQSLQVIKPQLDGQDKVWSLWIRSQRGPISAFTDYCGIVPKDMTPKYCHSCFPPKDKIIDFINPWHDDKTIIEVIKKYATWYPLDRLKLA